MSGRHVPWLVLGAVALSVALVPALRDQARLQWVTLPRHFERVPGRSEEPPRIDPVMDWAASYRQQCVRFAKDLRPEDASLTMAAGVLAPDRAVGLRLLERAAELDPTGVTLSAYLDGLLQRGLRYETPATLGLDPERPREIAEARRAITERGIPASLTEEDTRPVLSALARWRRAEPRNGLPAAVQAWCLYGLGQRERALALWQEAARAPEMSAHLTERTEAMRELLAQVGLPLPEAIVAAQALVAAPSLEALAATARIAYHEGRRAQLAGRAAEALGCWHATIAAGRSTQACARLLQEYQLGIELEHFGGAPAWRWLPDALTGVRGGPGIMQGRFFYGPQHSFYRSQVGEKGDAELRDAMVATKTRAMMLTRVASILPGSDWYTEGGELLVFGQLLAGLVAVTAIALIVLPLFAGSASPTTAGPRWGWHHLSSLPALFILAIAAGVAIALARECIVTPLRVCRGQDVLMGVGVAAIAAAVGPLLWALATRRREIPLTRRWATSARAGLATVVAVGALIYLALGLGAMDLRARWTRLKVSPISEMEQMRRAVGPRWDSPPIRPGSWVEDYPPGR